MEKLLLAMQGEHNKITLRWDPESYLLWWGHVTFQHDGVAIQVDVTKQETFSDLVTELHGKFLKFTKDIPDARPALLGTSVPYTPGPRQAQTPRDLDDEVPF